VLLLGLSASPLPALLLLDAPSLDVVRSIRGSDCSVAAVEYLLGKSRLLSRAEIGCKWLASVGLCSDGCHAIAS
jgi:hypothetical protein